MGKKLNIIKSVAIVFAIATAFCSCKSKYSKANQIDVDKVPTQVVDSMNVYQTKNGIMTSRIFAPKMEKFSNDSLTYDYFPLGIVVYSYTDDGKLESTIRANKAKHETYNYNGQEVWKAFGDVVIRNILKDETMKTDTLYWDKNKDEIYTDCYVSLQNKDGFMQGYGMKSDQRGRHAVILKPFDSYTVLGKEDTKTVDSVNFIGPKLKK